MTESVVPFRGVIPDFPLEYRARRARELRGLNQKQLAGELGIGLSTIQRVEQGTRAPKRATLMAWAMATGVDVDWLIGDDQPDPTNGAPSRTRTYDLRIKRSALHPLRPELRAVA